MDNIRMKYAQTSPPECGDAYLADGGRMFLEEVRVLLEAARALAPSFGPPEGLDESQETLPPLAFATLHAIINGMGARQYKALREYSEDHDDMSAWIVSHHPKTGERFESREASERHFYCKLASYVVNSDDGRGNWCAIYERAKRKRNSDYARALTLELDAASLREKWGADRDAHRACKRCEEASKKLNALIDAYQHLWSGICESVPEGEEEWAEWHTVDPDKVNGSYATWKEILHWNGAFQHRVNRINSEVHHINTQEEKSS